MPLAVKRALESIGLNDKETRVMIALLAGGTMYAAAVARATKLNRTTTYGILKELSEKGLVTTTNRDGVTRYQSIAPELLPAYIERRGKELLDIKKELAELVPQMKLIRAKGRDLPRVQFFEGTEGIERAYEDKLENNNGKMLYEFTGMDAGYKKLDIRFIEYYLKKRTRLGIQSEYISTDTPLGRKAAQEDAKYIRKVKFIPEKYMMGSEISIYDDKVSMTSFSAEHPVTILIEDENLARTMKTLFDYIKTEH